MSRVCNDHGTWDITTYVLHNHYINHTQKLLSRVFQEFPHSVRETKLIGPPLLARASRDT